MLTQEQNLRYARQLMLPELGPAGQEKLLAGRVLVLGAGGLGSAVSLYLAAAGVGTLGLADGDRVELSNLQRQLLHGTADVGREKLDSARDTLRRHNPDVEIRLHPGFATADTIEELIAPYDLVIDAADRFETKFLINDACVLAGKPYVHAGVARFGGQVMSFVPGEGPCLRCLLGDVPRRGLNGAGAGVLGAAVGVLGCLQALEAVKYLTGAGRMLTGRMLFFDGLDMSFQTARLGEKNPDCAVCGAAPSIRSLRENREAYQVDRG